MLSIALRMLFGDPVKLLGLVAGTAFSTPLMAQQGGFFVGLISRSSNGVTAIPEADVWVMDTRTETAESPVALRPIDLYRVRGVDGVDAAFAFLQATVTLRTADGRSTAATLYGLENAAMSAFPPRSSKARPQGSPGRTVLPLTY